MRLPVVAGATFTVLNPMIIIANQYGGKAGLPVVYGALRPPTSPRACSCRGAPYRPTSPASSPKLDGKSRVEIVREALPQGVSL